jgi:hypothetical protein
VTTLATNNGQSRIRCSCSGCVGWPTTGSSCLSLDNDNDRRALITHDSIVLPSGVITLS